MNVAELIDKLRDLPPELPVLLDGEGVFDLEEVAIIAADPIPADQITFSTWKCRILSDGESPTAVVLS